jgi:hypothetical protein
MHPTRALKLWMVLRMYGAEKLRALIRHHCAMAAWLADQVGGGARHMRGCGGLWSVLVVAIDITCGFTASRLPCVSVGSLA